MKWDLLNNIYLIFSPGLQSKTIFSIILTLFTLFLKACKNIINIFQVQNYVQMKGILRL